MPPRRPTMFDKRFGNVSAVVQHKPRHTLCRAGDSWSIASSGTDRFRVGEAADTDRLMLRRKGDRRVSPRKIRR